MGFILGLNSPFSCKTKFRMASAYQTQFLKNQWGQRSFVSYLHKSHQSTDKRNLSLKLLLIDDKKFVGKPRSLN